MSLSDKYGEAVVGGHQWKDTTAYSQNNKRPPNVWTTKVGMTRIVILRRRFDSVWEACTYQPSTETFILPLSPESAPEDAALLALDRVHKYLTNLAAEIKTNN